jgi:hypothetical protein
MLLVCFSCFVALTLHAKVAMLETIAWEWYILDAANEGAPPQRPSLDVSRSLKRR